ncbi:MAG: hypothetical protein NTZ73_02255 [Candidatus Diapherotrites archaeon]|nr:hypothetical protein [Candidatus Diapherotrites archaeon]
MAKKYFKNRKVKFMVNYKTGYLDIGLPKEDLKIIKRISEIRKLGNFQTVRKTIGDKKLVSLINRLYPKNNISTLEKIFGVPDSSINYWFKQLEIKPSRKHVNNLVVPANFNGSSVFSVGNKSTNFSAIRIDKDLAYLIGFCIGDGSVQKYAIDVFNKNHGMKEYLNKIMARYGKVKETNRKDGLWKLRLSSVKIADLIKRNSIIRNDTLNHIFSEKILAGNFLAGLWDSEGSVLKQKNYFHVYLYNSNKKLIDEVSNYLERDGIQNSVLAMKKRLNRYVLQGRVVKAKKTVYRIGIKKTSLDKWVNLIGLHLKHDKKYVVVKQILEECD